MSSLPQPIPALAVLAALAMLLAAVGWFRVASVQSMGRVAQAGIVTGVALGLAGVLLLLSAL